jgi:hypothetical protein
MWTQMTGKISLSRKFVSSEQAFIVILSQGDSILIANLILFVVKACGSVELTF